MWHVGKISSCLPILSFMAEHFQTTSLGKDITAYFCVCVMFTNMDFWFFFHHLKSVSRDM